MNQQRYRRFKTTKEESATTAKEKNLQARFSFQVEIKLKEMANSNVIMLGTQFMVALANALQYYIHLCLNNEIGWKNVKVILSDANVHGKGEHKIMSYIHLQRNLSSFNPNSYHCLYGLNTNLIMLVLASHELHFSILREVVTRVVQVFGYVQRYHGRVLVSMTSTQPGWFQI